MAFGVLFCYTFSRMDPKPEEKNEVLLLVRLVAHYWQRTPGSSPPEDLRIHLDKKHHHTALHTP